jgi:hypothetical protein
MTISLIHWIQTKTGARDDQEEAATAEEEDARCPDQKVR